MCARSSEKVIAIHNFEVFLGLASDECGDKFDIIFSKIVAYRLVDLGDTSPDAGAFSHGRF